MSNLGQTARRFAIRDHGLAAGVVRINGGVVKPPDVFIGQVDVGEEGK